MIIIIILWGMAKRYKDACLRVRLKFCTFWPIEYTMVGPWEKKLS